jgi:hypothetical protein
MKICIKITGLLCQIQKLSLLNINTKTSTQGETIVHGKFGSVDEAKEYLIVRALMFHQGSQKDMDQAVERIEKEGIAIFGSVEAKIGEL